MSGRHERHKRKPASQCAIKEVSGTKEHEVPDHSEGVEVVGPGEEGEDGLVEQDEGQQATWEGVEDCQKVTRKWMLSCKQKCWGTVT